MSCPVSPRTLLALLLLLSGPSAFAAYQGGENVVQHGRFDEDMYVAGGQVDVEADIDGDLLVTGGEVRVDSRIIADLMMLGGELSLRGLVGDDVRAAGGRLDLDAKVGDGLVAMGGDVRLARDAIVGGDAALCGGQVSLAGQVLGDVVACGGELLISGRIEGDAELMAQHIEIGPDAVILGDLTYRSPYPADIHPQARIDGRVTHIETPVPSRGEMLASLLWGAAFLWMSLAVTGLVLYLLLPRAALAAARTPGREPLKSLALGLAVFAATPFVAVLLLATGLGWLLGGAVMLSYLLLLLLGFLVGVLFLGDALLRRTRRGQEPGRLGNSLLFVLMLLLVIAVGLIPLLGWLLVLLVLFSGMGGMVLQLFRAQRQ